MPYEKETGKTPVYTFGICRGVYDAHLSNFLDRVNVPHMREGMYLVYEDSFDAYVKRVRRLGPFERRVHELFN